jgi:hypothetical protein
MSFTIKVEQMEKQNRKLEIKKELGRFNMSYETPDMIPNEEQVIYVMDPFNKGSHVGILEAKFEFIHNQVKNQ